MSRRKFLTGAAVAAGTAALPATAWTPAFRIMAGAAAATLPTPPNFPAGISLYQQAYQNWSEEIEIDAVWTCAPASANDVVTLANWAHANGYTLRPRGAMHGWTPLTVVNGASVDKVILADTTQHLNTDLGQRQRFTGHGDRRSRGDARWPSPPRCRTPVSGGSRSRRRAC